MIFRQLFDKDSSTYTYLLGCPETRQALLIDPVREQVERDLSLVKELDLTLKLVLETHVHADHVTGAGELRARTGATTLASSAGAVCVDRGLVPGEPIELGTLHGVVLATPGHTDDSLSFHFGDRVFSGDALLIRSAGRTDFQNGDPGQLFDSITTVLFALPHETLVYPAHDYQGLSVSTIGEEKRYNPRVAGKQRDEFIALMNSLKLPPPKLLDVAVPANRACGDVTQKSSRSEDAMSLYEAAMVLPDGVREVDVATLSANVGKVRIVDVREPAEYTSELGHVAGAELVPLNSVGQHAASWDKAQEIVLVCRSGGRSGQATRWLTKNGFGKIMNLRGGMLAWNDAKLPIER